MYELMYYGGIILSFTMAIICVVLFFRLNMMEVIDYYFKVNDKYVFQLEKFRRVKTISNKKVDNTIVSTKTKITLNEDTTLLEEEEISLEDAKRYATTLLDDTYLQREYLTEEFVLDGEVSSIPTTLL